MKKKYILLLLLWMLLEAKLLDQEIKIENDKFVLFPSILTTTVIVDENKTHKNEDETNNENLYYDIPLSEEIQSFIFLECRINNISEKLVISIIEVESDFDASIISNTNDYGLMQINKINHEEIIAKLGIIDFLDEKQNIEAGIYMLAQIVSKYDELNQILMVYNNGEAGAKALWDKGIYETEYSRRVIEKMNKLVRR